MLEIQGGTKCSRGVNAPLPTQILILYLPHHCGIWSGLIHSFFGERFRIDFGHRDLDYLLDHLIVDRERDSSHLNTNTKAPSNARGATNKEGARPPR